MSQQSINGFPLPDDYSTTRVPNAILGAVLSEVKDVETITLILRSVWLIERQRGYPRYISVAALNRDRVLSAILSDTRRFDECLSTVLELGVLAEVTMNGNRCVMLNTVSARRASLQAVVSYTDTDDSDGGWDTPAQSTLPPDAFRAYEENIGTLSPMIRESIMTALQDFTDEDISRAIRIAVDRERRSWSYIAQILRRWIKEGIPNEHGTGTLQREPEERDVSEDQLNRYIEYLRRQQKRGDDNS